MVYDARETTVSAGNLGIRAGLDDVVRPNRTGPLPRYYQESCSQGPKTPGILVFRRTTGAEYSLDAGLFHLAHALGCCGRQPRARCRHSLDRSRVLERVAVCRLFAFTVPTMGAFRDLPDPWRRTAELE